METWFDALERGEFDRLEYVGAKDPKLKKRTLTNPYNERPTWLKLAHEQLDRAVLAAYAATDPDGQWSEGWSRLWIEKRSWSTAPRRPRAFATAEGNRPARAGELVAVELATREQDLSDPAETRHFFVDAVGE